MPLLGHATWHLYRKLAEPDSNPLLNCRPRPESSPRYAADFPAVLFPFARDDTQ